MRVGIDLGTTYSVVARYNGSNSRTDVIRNKYMKDLTPSVICFQDDGSVVIGEDAKELQKGGAGTIASVFKVSMGSKTICAEVNGTDYSAEDLSKMMIAELVRQAEEVSGEKVESAVITVPAYFDDLQRSATRKAAEDAGVQVSKIINEPTAAAIYYGYKHSDGKNILVYDLGGGTFDVTLVHVSRGAIEVKGTYGNHNLGGKDWDEALMNHVCDRFTDEFGIDPRDDIHKRNELLADAEDYKKVLTKSGRANIAISYEGCTGRYPVEYSDFEEITAHLIDATTDIIDGVMEICGITADHVDEVLLCGGSTRLPQVTRHLKQYGFKNIVSHRDIDLAVAKGAAIVASLYSNDDNRIRDLVFKDVNAHSLGVLSIDPLSGKYRNEIMIPVSSRIPTSVTKPFRIEEGNLTDQVEIYMLQGESTIPRDCTIIKRDVVTGFENNGKGMVIDITYSYDEDGSVNVAATRNGRDLTIIHESVPDDLSWLSKPPKDRHSNKRVSKSIAICVDLSRSMESAMEEVKAAISNFVMSLSGEFTKFTIIGFGDRAKILLDLTTDEDEVLEMVNQLKPKKLGRGTDASPLPLVYKVMKEEKGARMALILTDGKWGNRDDAVDGAKECKEDMISLIAVGFGNEVDKSFLKQIATLEEGAMYTTLNNLGKTINTIATAIIDSPTGLVEHFR